MLVRTSVSADAAAIDALYPDAFPEEDLLPLVRKLLSEPTMVLSLVGVMDARVVGHACFTRCGDLGNGLSTALLGPVAVAPGSQKQGVGGSMIKAGFQELEKEGVSRLFVLGDPAYYGRFGFKQDSLVETPCPIPAEWGSAWQSRLLGESSAPCAGKLTVPEPWRQPGLWAP